MNKFITLALVTLFVSACGQKVDTTEAPIKASVTSEQLNAQNAEVQTLRDRSIQYSNAAEINGTVAEYQRFMSDLSSLEGKWDADKAAYDSRQALIEQLKSELEKAVSDAWPPAPPVATRS